MVRLRQTLRGCRVESGVWLGLFSLGSPCGEGRMQHTLDLPTGYRLRRDPDILTLCRSDGSMVARFSGAGADLNEIRKAAEQDYYPGTIYNQETPTPDAVTDQPCLQVRFF